MHFQNRMLRGIRIVFDPMAKVSRAIPKSGCGKGMISAGIDYQLDGRPLARAPFHQAFAVFGRRPIVKFADQDNGWNGQLIGGNAAQGIVGHGVLELQFIRDCKKPDRMS